MVVKRIVIKGIRNIRTISQYETIDGRKIKENALIRCGRIDKASKKNRNKFLSDYKVSAVIDLRTKLEREEGKSFVFPEGVLDIHLPVLTKSYFGITHEKSMSRALFKRSKTIGKDRESHQDYMVNMYKSIIFEEYSQNQFKEFFNILLNNKEGSIVYHCAGGKDRTGIASLFILTILGVSKEKILDDYSMSDIENRRHNRWLSFWIKALIFHKQFKLLLSEMLYAKREYMEKTIVAIEEKFGSVLNYLEVKIGIDKEKQNKLKELYLI